MAKKSQFSLKNQTPKIYELSERIIPNNHVITHNYQNPTYKYLLVHHFQTKTLSLVEFVLRELNFIPCKELSSINAHLKRAIEERDFERSALYMHFLFGILSINVHIKDAYRELLHLEIFLGYVQSNCAGK
jgi:hypothetical protein